MPDTDTRDNLDKGIQAEPEEGEGFILSTKVYRDCPFKDIVENRD
jgi:hypothetical protein